MKPFIPQNKRSVAWKDKANAQDILHILRKSHPSDTCEKENRMFCERMGVTHVNRTLREIARTGAKAIHTAACLLASIEEMSRTDRDLAELLSRLPTDKSPAASISELGMLLAEIDEYTLDRIEAAMLCSSELFNNDFLCQPLQEQLEYFE